MKKWKCPNCYKELETEDSSIMVQCGCGYAMNEQIKKKGEKDGNR